jgi:ribosomal protein S27AE
MYYINKNCPVCGGYVVLLDNGSEICEKCHYILPGSTQVQMSDSTKSSSSDKYCERCHTRLTQDGDWWICPECGYGYRITTGDPPELTEEYIKEMAKKITDTPFYVPGTAIGKAIGSLEPQTLTITNCEKFKVQLREVDIEFELEPDKLENIDTIIINGYKYVKER